MHCFLETMSRAEKYTDLYFKPALHCRGCTPSVTPYGVPPPSMREAFVGTSSRKDKYTCLQYKTAKVAPCALRCERYCIINPTRTRADKVGVTQTTVRELTPAARRQIDRAGTAPRIDRAGTAKT